MKGRSISGSRLPGADSSFIHPSIHLCMWECIVGAAILVGVWMKMEGSFIPSPSRTPSGHWNLGSAGACPRSLPQLTRAFPTPSLHHPPKLHLLPMAALPSPLPLRSPGVPFPPPSPPWLDWTGLRCFCCESQIAMFESKFQGENDSLRCSTMLNELLHHQQLYSLSSFLASPPHFLWVT